MLESLNDYLSLAVMVIFCVIGFVLLVSFLHGSHTSKSKKKKDRYYAFWKDISNGRNENDDDLFFL